MSHRTRAACLSQAALEHHGLELDTLTSAVIRSPHVRRLDCSIRSRSRCRFSPRLREGLQPLTVTAKSRAVGVPRKAGKKTSAGLRRASAASSGRWGRRRPARSRSGCKTPRSAQEHTKLRTALCRSVLSPPATQLPACKECRSSTPSHLGHQVSSAASATSNLWRSSVTKTAGSMA